MSRAVATDQRVATVREFIARVFNERSPERAREYMTPEVVWHGGTLGTVEGIDGMVGLLTVFLGALSDLHADEQDVISSGDLVAVRLRVSARHMGDLLGIPATGRQVQWDAVDIYKVTDDGKIGEEWASDDMAAFGSQLGAFALPWEVPA